jgi:Fur family ferric uptake transcriptional regulator
MPQAIASFNPKVNRNQQITVINSFIAEGLDCRHHTSYTGGCITPLADGNDAHMTNGLLKKCLSNGIRMTSQRQIIVGVIESSEDHPDVDQLYRRAVEEDHTISIATIYRTVKLLEEAGVIDRLEFGDGRARYEESGQHHEHLVDVETGEVIEFYHAELEALKEQIAREMGYELVDHRLELFGRKLK